MRLAIIVLFNVLLIATSTHAVVIEFENEERPLWFDAVGGKSNVTTIGFTEFPNNTTLADQYSDLGVTFDGLNFVTGPTGEFHDDWGLRIFGTDTPGNDLYFDEPINWIAADFLGSMRIGLYSGETLFYTSTTLGPGGPTTRFGGIVSDIPFDHVRIFDPLDPLTVLDDLHFGPPIPTPATFVPLLLMMSVLQRRRR